MAIQKLVSRVNQCTIGAPRKIGGESEAISVIRTNALSMSMCTVKAPNLLRKREVAPGRQFYKSENHRIGIYGENYTAN